MRREDDKLSRYPRDTGARVAAAKITMCTVGSVLPRKVCVAEDSNTSAFDRCSPKTRFAVLRRRVRVRTAPEKLN